ncbi:MAG: hypothetical protein SV422_00775 [Pseudomonadota bacterium]|nr:hypothetical protein [Pseudomonadota bacterium]
MNLSKIACIVLTLAALPAQAMENVPGEPMDEVTVVGQRTLMALRFQAEAAQEEVHRLYNDLNAIDEFDIVCKLDERYFSHIKERQCRPKFAWNAAAEEGQLLARRARGELTVQSISSASEVGFEFKALREQFVKVLSTSPELFDAVAKHGQLMEELKRARAEYFGRDDDAERNDPDE